MVPAKSANVDVLSGVVLDRNSLHRLARFVLQRRTGHQGARSLFPFSNNLVVRVQNVATSEGLLGLLQSLLVSELELLFGFHEDPLDHRRVRFGMKPAKNSCRSHDDLKSGSFGHPAGEARE